MEMNFPREKDEKESKSRKNKTLHVLKSCLLKSVKKSAGRDRSSETRGETWGEARGMPYLSSLHWDTHF